MISKATFKPHGPLLLNRIQNPLSEKYQPNVLHSLSTTDKSEQMPRKKALEDPTILHAKIENPRKTRNKYGNPGCLGNSSMCPIVVSKKLARCSCSYTAFMESWLRTKPAG